MKKIAIIIAIVGLVGWAEQSRADGPAPVPEAAPIPVTAPAMAADPIVEETLETAAEPVPRKMRISERFGRSMANIFSSPLELPAQIYVRAKYQDDRTDNPFAVAGGLIEGIPMGALVYFPWRLYAGIVDLCTLWAPECDKALIYPEYISFSPDFIDRTNLPVDKNPKVDKKK